MRKIIHDYTREAGVRNLERQIATLCRKVAKDVAAGCEEKKIITPEVITELLGPIKFYSEVAERTSEPGVATGLAWTPTGGDILFIEATQMDGNKNLILTGQSRSEEHTSELQSHSFISYAVFCLKKKKYTTHIPLYSSLCSIQLTIRR